MVINKCTSLYFVVFLLLFGLCWSQENAEASNAELADTPSEVICSTCNCTGTTVDCTGRDIQQPFELSDWEGIKDSNPLTIDFSNNPLGVISRISSLPVQTLNFSGCSIEKIDDASFTYLKELVSLDLSRNKLSTSAISRRIFMGVLTDSQGILSYDRIRYLSLAHNDVHSLPQDLFIFMSPLKVLDLSGNPLAYLDQVTMAALSDLVNLRELYMSGCELEVLPEGMFRRQRYLRRLDLSDNRFTTVPDALGEITKLQFLNFGKNPIQKLESDNALKKLSALQELSLCRNSKLESIAASALGGLTNLVTLHLCYNPRLTTVDPDFLVSIDDHEVETWPVVTELYMNNNNLSHLSSGYLHRWDKLVAGDFTNNPYECDCDNRWAVDVLVPLLDQAVAVNMICKKPPELRGLSFAQLRNSSKELPCSPSETIQDGTMPDLAIILGIMIGIFVTFPLVLIIVLLWRKGYFARCRRNKNEESDEETDEF